MQKAIDRPPPTIVNVRIAPRRTRGSDDGCHTTEPSSLYAWILVVMFCSGLPVKQGHLKDGNAAVHSVTAPA